MTFDEFSLIVKGLKSVYTSPNFLPDQWSMKTWYSMLSDLEYSTLQAVAVKYICNNKFPPTVADLREACLCVADKDGSEWLTAWSDVCKAIGRYGYMRADDAISHIRKKDPIAADIVERMGWRNLCCSEAQQVDRATFRNVYEAQQRKRREVKQMPAFAARRMEEIQEENQKYEKLLGIEEE